MTDTKYNGWTNWETWATNLHFDCSFEEDAQTCYDESEADETFSREEKAAFALAERIQETVTEFATSEGYDKNLFVQEIINGFLSSVNWYEVAKGYIESVEKEEQAA